MKNWLDDLVDSSSAASHIAWAGELEFKSASETDSVGRTVQFILRRQQKELGTAHPFSAHTRRRRGRAGTMFHVALTPINAGPSEPQGMMLLNWGSSPKGDTATFLLDQRATRHPFLGCTRAGKDQDPTRWMAVFVEEDDQSAPVDQRQRAKVESLPGRDAAVEGETVCMVCKACPATRCVCTPVRRKPKQRIKNSNLAAQFIKNPNFHRYVAEMFGELDLDRVGADRWLKEHLGVDSKAECDGAAADRFNDLRIDFIDWQTQTFGPEGLIS